MKNFKKRLLCLLLCVCMCSSLTFFANAVEPLDGSINADDNAQLIVAPTVEISNDSTGAAAVGYNISTESVYYYHISGAVFDTSGGMTYTEPGWMPGDDGGTSLNNIVDNDGDGVIEDTRAKVEEDDILMNPHRAIVLVETVFLENGVYKPYAGTAIMISPNVALTAAHNLYDDDFGWSTSVTVTPAKNSLGNGDREPFGSAYATDVAISVPYHENEKKEHDWGLIRLSSPIGNSCGYVGFQFREGSLVTGEDDPYCLISGYPGDRNGAIGDSGMITCDQYYDVGEIIVDTTGATIGQNGSTYPYRKLYHRIDATKGQSGSPILFPDFFGSGGFVIVGIHTHGVSSEKNLAVGIDNYLYSFMLAYKNRYLNS